MQTTLARGLGRQAVPRAFTHSQRAASFRAVAARPVPPQAALRTSQAVAVKSNRSRTMQVRALFGTKTAGSLYDYQVKDIDGKPVSLDKYKGKVLLVVNLASACGFTPQYAELQQLYDSYASKGLVVLGFPCNQFGGQEPGSNADIKRFAKSSYGVTFPLMAKVDVNGSNADPLFDFLKSAKGGFLGSKDIKWNFTKFLVNKEGKVVERYGSVTTPQQIEADIKKYI